MGGHCEIPGLALISKAASFAHRKLLSDSIHFERDLMMKASSNHNPLADISLSLSLSLCNFTSLPISSPFLWGLGRNIIQSRKFWVTFSLPTVSHAFCPLPEIHALPPFRGIHSKVQINQINKILMKEKLEDRIDEINKYN